jgi:CDP-diacylglycerol--glycerol-3-phosphate 3-phosphatidyltransferase
MKELTGYMKWKRAIPWSMVAFRAVLAPLLVVLALRLNASKLWFGAMIAAACLSDIYDGILARRWGTATARLRVADTVADTAFYLAVLAAIILRHGQALRERIGLLAAVLTLELLRALFDWIKFRRIASYHTYSAKLWGLSLAVASIALLCFNHGYWLLTLALVLGILCDLEGLAISVILNRWTPDVKTLRAAFTLREHGQSQ